MRQKETEVEETTVERVYCDECGTEATNTYRIEPREVCPECSDETWFDSVGKMASSFGESSQGEDGSILYVLPIVALSPLLIVLMYTDLEDISDLDMGDYIFLLTFFLGGAIWATIITLLVAL